MTESVIPLMQVMVEMPCDICQQGVMRPVLKSGGLRAVPTGGFEQRGVQHKCSQCGQVSTYKDSYPVIKYVNFLDFISDSQAVLNRLKQERENGSG